MISPTIGGALDAHVACIRLEMGMQKCRKMHDERERREAVADLLKIVDALPTWRRDYIRCLRDDLASSFAQGCTPRANALCAVRALSVLHGIYIAIWIELEEKGGEA